jgi:de-etiolated-1
MDEREGVSLAWQELLELYEDYHDSLRVGAAVGPGHAHMATCSNSAPVREQLRRHQGHTRGGSGRAHAARRVTASLPFAPQTLSVSPYLDRGLFSYDDKLVSVSERPKPCADVPIKFYARASGALRFKLHPPVPPRLPAGAIGRNKRWATYVFHPTLPLALSVQQSQLLPPTVNVHFHWS